MERRGGFVSRGPSILDKPVSKGKSEVPLSTFAFIFSELVQYSQTRVSNTSELETRLIEAGQQVGARMLDVVCFRDKNSKREIRIVDMLKFISSTVWKALFGKNAESLERSTDNEDEYMICEKESLVNRFISVPKDMGHLNPASFVAGIVKGVLDSANFSARVTAHFVSTDTGSKTVILIKFVPEVIAREKLLAA
eukprot:c10279_g1_i1.p1 GENE.c10279_g1_i1~~c10279_g1_i1.p1  ORF type:complete len:210 (-),score=53.70 c10279_g1_i1:340-924(-)